MVPKPSQYLRIHQVIHGYRDGHRLLASSVDITQNSSRRMLVMSDMSGPSMLKGFSNYVTGYPLPDMPFYVLAKTWYASEMERPGCVWTHSLLIRSDELGEIDDVQALARCFKRPSAEGDVTPELEAFSISGHEQDPRGRPLHSEEPALSARVLAMLYGSSESPIFLPAGNAMSFENLMLAIWGQQWPELRHAFTFCTGSLSIRKCNGRVLDLQVVPTSLVREIERREKNAAVVSCQDHMDRSAGSTWVSLAVNDLGAMAKGSFRQFVWRFSRDLPPIRKTFAALGEVFASVEATRSEGGQQFASLLNVLVTSFPQPSSANSLKEALVGRPGKRDVNLVPKLKEVELLSVLLADEQRSSAFSSEALDMRSRAASFWSDCEQSALGLVQRVVDSDVGLLGEQFLAGVADALGPEDAGDLRAARPGLLSLFVTRKPSLAVSAELWRGTTDEHQELVEAVLNSGGVPDELGQRITHAVLEAKAESIANRLLQGIGGPAVDAALSWLEQASHESRGYDLGTQWRQALARFPSAIVGWLSAREQVSTPIILFAASVLDPHSKMVRDLGAKPWLSFHPGDVRGVGEPELLHTSAFVLVLGLRNIGRDAERLAVSAFEVVHEALAESRLSYDDWRILEPLLPEVAFWRSWDRCRRLRLGLIRATIVNGWPTRVLLDCTAREGVFRRLVDSCRSSRDGRRLLRQVRHQVSAGQVRASEFQREMLRA